MFPESLSAAVSYRHRRLHEEHGRHGGQVASEHVSMSMASVSSLTGQEMLSAAERSLTNALKACFLVSYLFACKRPMHVGHTVTIPASRQPCHSVGTLSVTTPLLMSGAPHANPRHAPCRLGEHVRVAGRISAGAAFVAFSEMWPFL